MDGSMPMKVGDLVRYKAPSSNHGSVIQNDIGIVIELRPYTSDIMTKVFWSKNNESWSVLTKDLDVINRS